MSCSTWGTCFFGCLGGGVEDFEVVPLVDSASRADSGGGVGVGVRFDF